MTITFVGLVILFLVAVALFARLKPAGLPPHMAKRINMITIGAVVLGCLAVTSWLWLSLKGGPDSGWWVAIATIYCLGIVVVSLVIASFVRIVVARRCPVPNNSLERTRDR